MPTISEPIEKVEVIKSGEGKRGPWTLYGVHVGGMKMTTFDGGWEHFVGQTIPIEYEIERAGKFTNFKIMSAAPKAQTAAPIPTISDDRAVLLEIFSTVKRIEQNLKDGVPF